MPVFEGIKYGLVLIMIIGPSFFYLIRVGIMKGFRCAAGFAFGILLTDAFFIFAIFFGLSEILKKIEVQTVSSIIAGAIMFYLGYSYLVNVKKDEKLKDKEETNTNINLGITGYVLKGMAINGLNPFTIIMWIAVLATVMTREDYSDTQFFMFFVGLLGTVVSADIIKAYLAHRIAKVLTHSTLLIMNKVLGVIFLGLSIRFFYFAFVNYKVLLGLKF